MISSAFTAASTLVMSAPPGDGCVGASILPQEAAGTICGEGSLHA